MRYPSIKQIVTPARGGYLGMILAICPVSGAAQGTVGDWPDWVAEEERLRQRIAGVNEGELSFLGQSPSGVVHHHRSRVVIGERSLIDGWVVLEQCHDHLDRVEAAQIVFKPERSRALQVVSFRNIEAAYAEGNTIQLRRIGPASEVCLRAESLALHDLGDGIFELRNGPFMRRFLDGFYPLRLSLTVDYPVSLTLAELAPESQPGFEVKRQPGRVAVEALFEGRLHTRFRFLRE